MNTENDTVRPRRDNRSTLVQMPLRELANKMGFGLEIPTRQKIRMLQIAQYTAYVWIPVSAICVALLYIIDVALGLIRWTISKEHRRRVKNSAHRISFKWINRIDFFLMHSIRDWRNGNMLQELESQQATRDLFEQFLDRFNLDEIWTVTPDELLIACGEVILTACRTKRRHEGFPALADKLHGETLELCSLALRYGIMPSDQEFHTYVTEMRGGKYDEHAIAAYYYSRADLKRLPTKRPKDIEVPLRKLSPAEEEKLEARRVAEVRET